MSADPKQVLRILDYRGIDVRVEEGRLVAKSRHGHIPDDMVRFIDHFKEIILAELEARRDISMCTARRPIHLLRLPGKSSGGTGTATNRPGNSSQRKPGGAASRVVSRAPIQHRSRAFGITCAIC